MTEYVRPRSDWSVLRSVSLALGVWVIATIGCFLVWRPLFEFFYSPVADALSRAGIEEPRVLFAYPTEAFFMGAQVAAFSGFVLALPVAAFSFARIWIVAPSTAGCVAGLALLLFLAGAGYVWRVHIPEEIAGTFGTSSPGWTLYQPLSFAPALDWMRYTLTAMFAAGSAFLIPAVIVGWYVARRSRMASDIAREF